MFCRSYRLKCGSCRTLLTREIQSDIICLRNCVKYAKNGG